MFVWWFPMLKTMWVAPFAALRRNCISFCACRPVVNCHCVELGSQLQLPNMEPHPVRTYRTDAFSNGYVPDSVLSDLWKSCCTSFDASRRERKSHSSNAVIESAQDKNRSLSQYMLDRRILYAGSESTTPELYMLVAQHVRKVRR